MEPDNYPDRGMRNLTATASAFIPVKNYYLLMIAIDNYQPGYPGLSNPVRDANNVLDILTTEYKFKQPDIPDNANFYTKCLFDAKATKSEIIKAIENIYDRIGENDALLIYFAGHGIFWKSNKQYYLVCADSIPGDRGTHLYIDEIYSQFKDYTADKKCRDLLLILDSCYSGSASLGTSESLKGNFSRTVLMSSLPEQTASDGPVGRGSAFANAFISFLNENSRPYLFFNAIPAQLESKFEISGEKVSDKQKLFFRFMPGKYGEGYFVFEKEEKNKPNPEDLQDSLIDKLDFGEHRAALENFYKKGRNNLNIITTQGYSFNVQKVLSKIVFRFMATRIPFQPEYCMMLDPVKIDKMPSNDVWEVLYNQVKLNNGGITPDKASLHDWFFQKLMPGDDLYNEKRHVILWIYFSLGGKENFERIQTFCDEFSTLFLDKLSKLSEDEKKKLGKMFILFSDERESDESFPRERFDKVTKKDNFNLITTASVKPINNIHVERWVEAIAATNQSTKIQELKDPKVVMKIMGKPDCDEFECKYEEFVQNLSAHCNYSDEEKIKLAEYLFDFKKYLI